MNLEHADPAGRWTLCRMGRIYCSIFSHQRALEQPPPALFRSLFVKVSWILKRAGPLGATLLSRLSSLVIMLPITRYGATAWNGELEFLFFRLLVVFSPTCFVLHFWHEPFNPRFHLVSEYMITT
ncbi:hypothetical protein BJX99DRAFT_210017 [Aspergillus californicus]